MERELKVWDVVTMDEIVQRMIRWFDREDKQRKYYKLKSIIKNIIKSILLMVIWAIITVVIYEIIWN